MKNLNPYNGDAKSEYKNAVARKPKISDARIRLNSVEANVLIAYDNYKKNFDSNSLHTTVAHGFSADIKNDLKDMYDYQNRIIKNIRANITNQQIITIQNTCQNCTIDTVCTMDHVLPKEKFPEFAVNGHNLFPCCSICNEYKSEIIGATSFLNLFLDKLPDVQYLFVSIYQDLDSVNFRFYLSNKGKLIDNALYVNIENHYANLHLLDRMTVASRTYLSAFISSNKPHYRRYGKDYIIETVHESINECRNAYGYNYWKCSLELALIESADFWNYMDELCV